MVSLIKGICIFMIIAQAILLLVPGNSYMKYVKVLIGILMILMILRPVLSWIWGEEGAGMEQMLYELEEEMPKEQDLWENKENDMGIYSSIEEELKYKLNQAFEEAYCVKSVELKGTEKESAAGRETEIEYILITVSARAETERDRICIEPVILGKVHADQEKETETLKQKYGEYIGIDPERIEIRVSYG